MPNDILSSEIQSSAGKVAFNSSSAKDYATSESYKTLRTNILFSGVDIKSIVITSCRENEGKSTISTELSQSLAESGKRTILIDADLRKSEMLRQNGRGREINGLSELLSGQCTLEQVVYNTNEPNFDVIFCGHYPPNPVELLGSGKFEQLVSDFKKIYDYIIIDSPPLGAVIDAAVIASYCDGAILVITDGKISYHEANNVKEQILKSGCKLLGAVLNDTEPRRSSYYKRYYKGSEYKYSAEYK